MTRKVISSGIPPEAGEGQRVHPTVSPLQPTASIGHNQPPRHIAFAAELDDVHLEATSFLDGGAIETPGQADAIGTIIAKAKAIKRDADAARKQDKEPHLAAGRAVDADYKPIETKADAIILAASMPLTTWLLKQADEQREAERIARENAARLAQEAVEAERAASGNLAAIEAVAGLQRAADDAAKEAARAGKAKPLVQGMDRAIGLRSYWTHAIINRRELLNWIAKNDPDALTAMLDEYARSAVSHGTRWLPGVTIEQERRVA